MFDLRTAITIVEIVVGVAVALIVGDYLGYKFGRWKVASYSLFTMLGFIVAFAIFAAVWLNTRS